MSISFETRLLDIQSHIIIKIPKGLSEAFPSRGMVMAKGNMNGFSFITPLEPDGMGSHWFEVTDTLCQEANILVGQTLQVTIEVMDDWIDPVIPADIMDAIIHSDLQNQWNGLTTKARWEWLRWIRSTKNLATRQKRINVACSKLQKGDKRPCCFDASRCTVEEVSKSGILINYEQEI